VVGEECQPIQVDLSLKHVLANVRCKIDPISEQRMGIPTQRHARRRRVEPATGPLPAVRRHGDDTAWRSDAPPVEVNAGGEKLTSGGQHRDLIILLPSERAHRGNGQIHVLSDLADVPSQNGMWPDFKHYVYPIGQH
jgi:hypothetical protein